MPLALFALTLAVGLNRSIPPEFDRYLAKPDLTYSYRASNEGSDRLINLTSQTWQGAPWQHKILFRPNPLPLAKGLAILFITGSGPNAGDRFLLNAISQGTKLPTAVLFDIPNQPLYGGLVEDDLIAYTFQRTLETGDATWPLLFPMTKSALRAMDAIVSETKSSANPITHFIVSGASKRGWTTWMVGASGDRRVRAIAPMVIDNLNLGRQMSHQLEVYGQYSDQIEAYTKLGLQAKFVSQEGKHLAEMVDPYTYRSRIKIPTLIINGGNDPYWTVDASSLYYGDLRQPKWIVTVPNAGHGLGDGVEALETFAAFCRSIAGELTMPKERWAMKRGPEGRLTVSLQSKGLPIAKFGVWVAESSTLDFRAAKYGWVASTSTPGPDGRCSVAVDLNPSANSAVFGEVTYGTTPTYRLCSPTQVFRIPSR